MSNRGAAVGGIAISIVTHKTTRENALIDHEGLVLGNDAEVRLLHEGMRLVTGRQTAGDNAVVERAAFNRHVRRADRGLCTLVGIAVVDDGCTAAHNGTVEGAALDRDTSGADLRLGISVREVRPTLFLLVIPSVLHEVAAKYEKLRAVGRGLGGAERTSVDGHACDGVLVDAGDLKIVAAARTADHGIDLTAVDHDMRVLHCGMVDLISIRGIVTADRHVPLAALNGHRVVERNLLSGVAPVLPTADHTVFTVLRVDVPLGDGDILTLAFDIHGRLNACRERQSACNGNGHCGLSARLMGLRHLVDNRHGAARPVKDNLECRIHFAIPLVMFDNRAVAQCAAKFPRFHVSRTGGETLPSPRKLKLLKYNCICRLLLHCTCC